MEKVTQVGILGIGAIGTIMSVLLIQNAALKVHLYSRTARAALKLKKGKDSLVYPVEVHTSVQQAPRLDWLIICLKMYHYANASDWLKKLISPQTKVVVIRNGIALKASVAPYAQENQILECMIDCPVQMEQDHFYRQWQKPKLMISDTANSRAFKKLFPPDDVNIEILQDFKTASWKKLCESASLGAILCLSGETCWIFKDQTLQQLYLDLLEECIAVARADGAVIETDFKARALKKLLAYDPHKGSSMLSDRLNGQPIELEAKNGAVVKMAAKYGIKVPLNKLACQLLKYTNRRLL